MREIATGLMLLLMSVATYGQSQSNLQLGTGTMVRAETMTADEESKLAGAQDDINKAVAHLEEVKASIAKDHKMSSQSWMEWSEWYEFDGKFIIQRHLSNILIPEMR